MLRLAVAEARNLETRAQRVHGLDSDTVEADRFFEHRAVVFGAGVHFRRSIDQLAAAIVSHTDRAFIGQGNVNLRAEAHHIFVDGVVENLFKQNVDSVIEIRAIAQFADIHARAAADMLFRIKRDD